MPRKPSSETSTQGAPGFTLFPRLAPRGLQMHRPRQGCTSLGSTETLLCFGSWSPDALIESLRPCRNQREGKGARGLGRGWEGVGARKHIWHLRNPADSHNLTREMYRPYKKRAPCFPPLSQRQQKSHPRDCVPTNLPNLKKESLSKKQEEKGKKTQNNSPSGGTSPANSRLLFGS